MEQVIHLPLVHHKVIMVEVVEMDLFMVVAVEEDLQVQDQMVSEILITLLDQVVEDLAEQVRQIQLQVHLLQKQVEVEVVYLNAEELQHQVVEELEDQVVEE